MPIESFPFCEDLVIASRSTDVGFKGFAKDPQTKFAYFVDVFVFLTLSKSQVKSRCLGI
jgi:hypothetical protein